MPPAFTKSLKRVDGNIDNPVSMDCKVSGSQPMTVTWFKDDQEIVSGDKFQPEFKDSSAILRIMWLEKADSGVYKCRATNSAGFKENSGTLYVKGHEGLAYLMHLVFLRVISESFHTNVKCKFVLLASRTASVHSETTRPGCYSRNYSFLKNSIHWNSSFNCEVVQGRKRHNYRRHLFH